jgi:hypothetical protein
LGFAQFKKKIAKPANHAIINDRIFLLIVDLANTITYRFRARRQQDGKRVAEASPPKDFGG